MRPPDRRIWIYPCDGDDASCEVLFFGRTEEIAPFYVEIKAWAERWPGFTIVQAIVQGDEVIGMRLVLAGDAKYDSPVREALHMLGHLGVIAWRGQTMPDTPIGVVGTW